MKNSLHTCQHYVAEALRAVPKDIVSVHYMDDIMRAPPDSSLLQGATSQLLKGLEELNPWAVPPKIQSLPVHLSEILYF